MQHTEPKCCENCVEAAANYEYFCGNTSCPCHKVQHTEESWEKKFDEKFGVIPDGVIPFSEQYSANDHKSFIRATLEAQKKELREKVEGMKKIECKDWCRKFHEHYENTYYNRALDDIVKLLS